MAEHFIREGRTVGADVQIFSYELHAEVPVSEVTTIIPGLKWNDPELLPHIKRVIVENNIEIVIPFLDPATFIAAQLQADIPQLFVPVSDERVCGLFFSKIQAYSWCVEHKIPVPANDLSHFPLIAKPDKGSASKGIVILHNGAELEEFLSRHDVREYLVQKFIKGTEYTVDAYRSCSIGNINYLVPRVRLEVQGGESIRTRTIKHAQIAKLSRLIIEKSGLMGAITLQYLEDGITGEVYFMEVNPRFGGAVVTAIGAGVNVAHVVLNDFLKEKTEEVTDWKENLLMMRRFQEIYRHANHH